MQSATGQYGTQAGEPAQPVQHSVMTAISLGRFLRGVAIPSDFGSILTTAVDMQCIMTQTSPPATAQAASPGDRPDCPKPRFLRRGDSQVCPRSSAGLSPVCPPLFGRSVP